MRLSKITKSSPAILLLLTSVILSHSAANVQSLHHSPHEPLNISRIKRDAFVETSTLPNGENDGREEISGSPEGLDGVKTIAPSRVSVKPTMTVTATRIGMTRYFTPPLRSSSPASPPQLNTTPQTPPQEESLDKNEKDLTSSPTPLFPDPGEEEENDVEDEGNVDQSVEEEETPARMKGREDNKDSWNSVQAETEEDAEGAEGEGDAEVGKGTETEEQVDEEAELLSVLGGSRRNFDPTWKNFSDPGVSGGEFQENNSTTTPKEHNHPQQPDSTTFPLNMQGGRGVDDNPEHPHKNASHISDSITFQENEILETLPQPALLVGSTGNSLFPNETTATLEEDFAQAFNNNGGEGTQRRRRLRGPVRRRVRKMRIPKPDNATTGISSDTFFYPPSEYFTPNLNANRPNSFNQGQYLTRSNPVTKPDTRIRMVRRFRSTTTALPPTNPNDFPQTTTESPNGGNQLRAAGAPTFSRFNDGGGVGGGPKKPVILLRSPTIPTRQDNDEEFDLSEDESEPQIERPNSYPYTEKSNTFTDDLANTITPDQLGQGVKQGGPGGSAPPSQTPRVHNNETGEWLQSEHSKHHDISHDNEPTLHPYAEDRDQWEQNYMNLQQNSFFSPSAEQPDEETPIITAEDVLAKHHRGQGEEGQHHESFERTLTKSVSMSDGPDPTQIVQSYNTREPSVTVVEHHHHLPTVTINHPPTYDEGSQILHDSFNDDAGLSSPPLPPPPTPPKYLPETSSLYGEDKIPSGSYPSQQLQQSSGGNNYFRDNPSPYSSGLSPSPFKPYLSSPDQSAFSSQSEGGQGAKKKTRGGGSHYDRTRHRYSQHPPPNELFQDNKGAYPDTSNYSNTRLHSNPSNTSPTFTSTDAKENLAPPPNPPPPHHSGPSGPSMFSSHEFPNHPQGSKTIPGPPPPGFRNPYIPKIEDHFSAMRNSIFKESNSFPQIPPPQSYSHFSKGPAAVDHHDPSMMAPTKSSSFQTHHHHPPPTGDGQVPANSPSSSSFIPGITGSSPFNSLSTYINEHPPSQSQSKKRPAPVWPGKQAFSTNPSGPSRSPKKMPEGSYSHVNPMDSPSNSFRTSSHYGGGGGGPPDFSPYHPSFYDASSPNSPKLTLPMPGLVSIPTPPPDSHAMNQVTPNRHFPPHTHSMSSSSDYEPANPPLPAGHALSQHFDHFVQNAGEFKDDDHHGHPHHDHHEEEGEYTEPEIITKNKSKPGGGKYKNRGTPSSTFTGKFPESKKNRNKYGNRRKPSKSKDNGGGGSESEPSPAGYYSSSSASSSGSPSRGKNQYKDLSPSQQSQPDITTIITSPDYANDASSSAMIEFDSPPSYEPTSPYSLPYSDQDYPDQYKQYKYKGRPKDYEDEDRANNQPKYSLSSKRPRKNNYEEQEYDLPSYTPSYQEEGHDNSIRDGENYSSHDHTYNKYEKESTGQDPPPKNPQSSSTKDNDSPQGHKPTSDTTTTTETEANPELDGSGPSPFSETPYVLMFPSTLQIRHPPRPSALPPSPPALSVLNAEIPMGSASEHLSPNPEKFLGPGLKAVPVHPRHQMMKVLATKQYLTHLEAVQERQRKPPPAIYTPYGVLVPMGLSSAGTQGFVPPPNKLQANAYSQLSPSYSYSAPLPAKQSLDEKSLLSVLLGHKSPPKLPFDSSSFKSDKTMDLKESIDPALDLLAEKLAIKLSSLEPFTPFRQSTSSSYPLLYMQGTSYSELKPVKTPYKNSTTVNKSKSSSAPSLRTSSASSSQTSSYFNKHPGNAGSGNLLSPQPEYQQQTLKQLSPAPSSSSSSSYSAQSQFAGEASPVLKNILKERLYEMLQESYAEAASSYSQSIAPTQAPTHHSLTQSFMKKLELSPDSQKSFIPDNPFSKKSSRQQQGSSSSKLLSSLLNFAGQPSSSSGANKYQSHHQQQQQQQQLQKKQHRPLYQPTGILSAIKRLFSYHPSPNNRQDSLNGPSVRKNSNISHPLLPPHPFASHPPTKRIKIPADSPWSGRRSSKKFTHPPPTSTTPSSKSTTTREGSSSGTKTEWKTKAGNSMQKERDDQLKPSDGIDPQAHGFKSVADMEKMLRYLLKLKPQLETEEKERKYSAEHHQHNPLLSSHSPTTLETLIHGKQRLANPHTLLHFLPSHPFSQETSASSSLVSKRSSNAFSTLNDLSASSSSTHSLAILPTSNSATTFLPLNMSSNKHLAQSKTSHDNLSQLTLPYQNHFFPIPTSWKPIPDSVSLPSSNPATKPQDPTHHSSSNSLASSQEKHQTQKAPSP